VSTPTLPSDNPIAPWKRLAIWSLFGGGGFAVVLVAVVGIIVWYSSRPTPPQRWNKDALVANEPPGFAASNDGKRVIFTYSVDNTTDTDYQLDSSYGIKVLIRDKEGSFSQPLSDEVLRIPVFIPTRQKGGLTLSLALSEIPVAGTAETDTEYHERLRAYCEKRLANVTGFVVFDDTKRYQINLPKWRSESRKAN
jgi:hypothetical protein